MLKPRPSSVLGSSTTRGCECPSLAAKAATVAWKCTKRERARFTDCKVQRSGCLLASNNEWLGFYLRRSVGPDFRTAVNVHRLIYMLINLGTLLDNIYNAKQFLNEFTQGLIFPVSPYCLLNNEFWCQFTSYIFLACGLTFWWVKWKYPSWGGRMWPPPSIHAHRLLFLSRSFNV